MARNLENAWKKEKWAIEKPKLDNARKLRGIYFIDAADAEFKETILKRMEEVGSSEVCSHALQDQDSQARGNL